MESTLVAKSASVLCIEREAIAGARAASSGENCGGGGSTSRAITHRDPRSSPISLACSLGTYSDHIARTRGARRGLATGAASGSVAGEGRLTGLAGAVAVGVAGPQSASLSSSLSESWPPPVAPCPMVLLSPPYALLSSSGVFVGMVPSAHSAAFEPLSPCLPRAASSST